MRHAAGALLIVALAAVPAGAQPADSPEALLQRFGANFLTKDVAAQVALFAPDAALYGATVGPLLRGQDGVRGYFTNAWANAAPGTMQCEILSRRLPTPDLALVDATCPLVRPERTVTLRVSAVMQRDPTAGWRFLEMHNSFPPAPR